MTRFAACLSGMALGAVLMALLVYALWGAPHVHCRVEWAHGHDVRVESAPPVPRTSLPLRKEESADLPAPPTTPAPIPPEPFPPQSIAPEPATIPIESADSPLATDLPAETELLPSPQLSLLIPVQGVPATALYDTFSQARDSGRTHEAIDIMAPRGTPVIAAENGHVAKLFTSAQGGLTVYQFDASGRYALYYAHLDAYAPGLVEGAELKRGDPIGTVGSSGNASPDGPHLHFAVFLLGPERKWWQGTAVNPYPLLEH